MVSIIKSSQNVRRTVLYNEQKVMEGKALFLGAFNYWQDDAQLTLESKLQRFDDLVVLNERSQAHTIHISLNFHPNDQLTDKKMRQVATTFMEKIGFSAQPWLAYRHIDAGHPHMHIVTTNIRPDGDRITNDLRSPRLLVRYCNELERLHSLTPAKEHLSPRQLARLQPDQAHTPGPTHTPGPVRTAGPGHTPAPARDPEALPRPEIHQQRLVYGRSATKTGIADVLEHVLPHYTYTSLEHLNALLGFYHVRADRGSEEGIMYHNKGLYYRMIDERGKKIGAPIKASSFDTQPTLKYLEERFEENTQRLTQRLARIRSNIDLTLHLKRFRSFRQLTERLAREQIRLVIPPRVRKKQPRQSAATTENRSPGTALRPAQERSFFYVDWIGQTVCRDTDLGPAYTMAALMKRSGLEQDILTLVASQQLQPDKAGDLDILQGSDPVGRLNVLLSLTNQHNNLIDAQQKQEEAQALHQRLQHRISGHL